MYPSSNLTSAFDFRVQVLMCTHCGAPVTRVPTGGALACEYCGAEVLGVGPAAGAAGPLRYVSDPARDEWARAQIAAGYRSRLDLAWSFPPDLGGLAGVVGIGTWRDEYIPALLAHWQVSAPTLPRAPRDEGLRFRVFWIAVRLSVGYAFLAGDVTGQPSLDLRLRERAVLETALGLLGETPYADAIRCRLSRAASMARDLDSARAWLAPCAPHPPSLELDAEVRLAYAALSTLEGDPRGILEVLGPEGREVPVATDAEARYADCYRIHAYELIGDQGAWSRLLGRAKGRWGAAALTGAFETAGIAPKANRAVVRGWMTRNGVIVGLVIGVPVLIGLAAAAASCVGAFLGG